MRVSKSQRREKQKSRGRDQISNLESLKKLNIRKRSLLWVWYSLEQKCFEGHSVHSLLDHLGMILSFKLYLNILWENSIFLLTFRIQGHVIKWKISSFSAFFQTLTVWLFQDCPTRSTENHKFTNFHYDKKIIVKI